MTGLSAAPRSAGVPVAWGGETVAGSGQTVGRQTAAAEDLTLVAVREQMKKVLAFGESDSMHTVLLLDFVHVLHSSYSSLLIPLETSCSPLSNIYLVLSVKRQVFIAIFKTSPYKFRK